MHILHTHTPWSLAWNLKHDPLGKGDSCWKPAVYVNSWRCRCYTYSIYTYTCIHTHTRTTPLSPMWLTKMRGWNHAAILFEENDSSPMFHSIHGFVKTPCSTNNTGFHKIRRWFLVRVGWPYPCAKDFRPDAHVSPEMQAHKHSLQGKSSHPILDSYREDSQISMAYFQRANDWGTTS